MLTHIGESMTEVLRICAEAKAYAERPEVRARTEAWIRREDAKRAEEELRIGQKIVSKALAGSYGGAVKDAAEELVRTGRKLSAEETLRAAEQINVVRRRVSEGE